jgi:hypothetical protein
VAFGAVVAPSVIDGVSLCALGYAVLSLSVIRMLPVALALAGSGLQSSTLAFLGWFGPRGLASILYMLIVVETDAFAAQAEIESYVALTVLLSTLAHGVSAHPLSVLYGLRDRLGVPDGQDAIAANRKGGVLGEGRVDGQHDAVPEHDRLRARGAPEAAPLAPESARPATAPPPTRRKRRLVRLMALSCSSLASSTRAWRIASRRRVVSAARDRDRGGQEWKTFRRGPFVTFRRDPNSMPKGGRVRLRWTLSLLLVTWLAA